VDIGASQGLAHEADHFNRFVEDFVKKLQ